MNLNEKQGRGLLMVGEFPDSQLSLLRQIERSQLSGNAAIERARRMLHDEAEEKAKNAGGENAGGGNGSESAPVPTPTTLTPSPSSTTPTIAPTPTQTPESETSAPNLSSAVGINPTSSSTPSSSTPSSGAGAPAPIYATHSAQILSSVGGEFQTVSNQLQAIEPSALRASDALALDLLLEESEAIGERLKMLRQEATVNAQKTTKKGGN